MSTPVVSQVQPAAASLEGDIFDLDGKPLAGITVKLVKQDEQGQVANDDYSIPLETTSSDNHGHYRFGNLTPGKVAIIFSSPLSEQYATVVQSNIELKAGQTSLQNMKMGSSGMGYVVERGSAANDFTKTHQALVAQNPSGVRMWLKFPKNRKTYRIGELIEATLSYNVKNPQPYLPDTGYPPAAELDSPGAFQAFPSHSHGVVYPELYYKDKLFELNILACPVETEDAKHHERRVRHIIVSKWLRFTQPGRFRFYLTTKHSIYDVTKKEWITKAEVTSEMAEVNILPADAQLLETQLQEALRVARQKQVDEFDMQDEERDHSREVRERAYNVIAYQDTPASLKALLANPQHPNARCGNVDYRHGLLGTAHPELLAEQYHFRIRDPESAISDDDLYFLSRLEATRSLPAFGDHHGSVELKQSGATLSDNEAVYRAIIHKNENLLAQAIQSKHGFARAKSLITLMESAIDGTPKQVNELNPPTRDVLEKLGELLAPVFDLLDASTQEHLLKNRWRLIRSQAMKPLLESLVRSTDRVHQQLRAIAGERLKELDSPAIIKTRPDSHSSP